MRGIAVNNTPNPKQQQLDNARVDNAKGYLTTQQGVRVTIPMMLSLPANVVRPCWKTSMPGRK